MTAKGRGFRPRDKDEELERFKVEEPERRLRAMINNSLISFFSWFISPNMEGLPCPKFYRHMDQPYHSYVICVCLCNSILGKNQAEIRCGDHGSNSVLCNVPCTFGSETVASQVNPVRRAWEQ